MPTYLPPRNRLGLSATVMLGVVLAASPARSAPGESGYHLVNTIHLEGSGGSGRMALDARTHRLFVVRANHVTVVDVERSREIGKVTGTSGAHDVALVPKAGRGFTSNSATNIVSIFSLRTLRGTSDHPETGARPEAIVYDSSSGRIFTMNANSNNATPIDAADDAAAGSVPLGGIPASAVTDGEGRVFIQLKDRNEIAVLDAHVLRVVRRWPLAPCTPSAGLAIDTAHDRLFSACRDDTVAVLDTASGRVVARTPIGHCANVLGCDPGTSWLFAACDDGRLTVIRQESADAYRLVDTIRTAPGARALEIDPSTHRLYLAVRGGSDGHGSMALLVFDR